MTAYKRIERYQRMLSERSGYTICSLHHLRLKPRLSERERWDLYHVLVETVLTPQRVYESEFALECWESEHPREGTFPDLVVEATRDKLRLLFIGRHFTDRKPVLPLLREALDGFRKATCVHHLLVLDFTKTDSSTG